MKLDTFKYIPQNERNTKKPECKKPGKYNATIVSCNKSGDYLYVNFDLGETSISSSFGFWVDDEDRVDRANQAFSNMVDACGIIDFDGETNRLRGKKLTITVNWDKSNQYLRVAKFEKYEGDDANNEKPQQNGFDYNTPPNFINNNASAGGGNGCKRKDGLRY